MKQISTFSVSKSNLGLEVYSILGNDEVRYFKRMEAIFTTCAIAKKQLRNITILLNQAPFCEVNWNGKYRYIYNPNEDKVTSPELKQLFIAKGYAVN